MMGALKMEWKTKKSVWVGGSSPFSIDNDFMAAWEFELLLQKKEETLEHYGS